MKKLILVLSFYFLIIHVFSQETFFEFLQGWRSERIYETEDSYNIASSNAYSMYNQYIGFSEISLFGDSITNWSFELDTSSSNATYFVNSYSKIIDDYIYIAGYLIGNESNEFYGVLSKFSADLKTEIWSKPYILSNQSTTLKLATFKNDTSLILGSYNKNNNDLYTTFLETDTSGVIRWQKDFDCAGDCNMKPFHILPTEDNGFIFTCFESHINGQPGVDDFQTAVIKTDSLGNTEWRHTWGGDSTKNIGSWVVPLNDGNFLFAWTDHHYSGWNAQAHYGNTIRFVKFDISGNVIWFKDYSDQIIDKFYEISQMEFMPDGNILLAVNNGTWAGLIKMDQEADLIWHRENMMPPGLAYEENTASAQHLKILGVTFTSDDGFILAGEYFSSPGNMFPEVYQSAFAYKLDEYGCYEPGCHIHDNIDVVASDEDVGFTLQPNPAKHFVQVKSSKLKVASIAIYNVMGKLVKNILLKEGSENQTFDVSDLEPGIYLVKIGEQTEKLVVE